MDHYAWTVNYKVTLVHVLKKYYIWTLIWLISSKDGFCPLSQPYPYFYGTSCCKYNEDCHGNQLGRYSTCCQGNDRTFCPDSVCLLKGNYSLVAILWTLIIERHFGMNII